MFSQTCFNHLFVFRINFILVFTDYMIKTMTVKKAVAVYQKVVTYKTLFTHSDEAHKDQLLPVKVQMSP